MQATRRLLSNSFHAGFGMPPVGGKLLLPPPTFWDNVLGALQGLWSIATDPTQRQAFEDAINNRIIKDDVLKNAHNGAIMTFSLFWNLQNPLWKTKSTTFDAQDFLHNVGPALTNLHDFLHSFQNQVRQEYLDFKAEQEENPDEATEAEKEGKDKKDEDAVLTSAGIPIEAKLLRSLLQPQDSEKHFFKFLEKPHPWRESVQTDPDGLAACLSRMTSEEYLDGFVTSSKVGLNFSDQAVYEEGSAKVGQVAILNARAMEIPLPGQSARDEDDHRYEEFRASEEANLKMGVAAQIDVLYEVTNRFQEKLAVLKEDGQAEFATERVEYTSLGVAVFEGWLEKGEDSTEDFRWRVPLMREASEFPMIASTLRTALPPANNEEAGQTIDSTSRGNVDNQEADHKETANEKTGDSDSQSKGGT